MIQASTGTQWVLTSSAAAKATAISAIWARAAAREKKKAE